MKRRQIAGIGLTLVVVFGAASTAFQWGLSDIVAIEALDKIDRGLEPAATTEAVRERLSLLEAIPASGFLAPERMEELRGGLKRLEQALTEIQAAKTEVIRKSKIRDFRSKLISVKVDLKMTAEGLGFIRSLYRLIFLILLIAGVATAIGWPGIGALITLVATFIAVIGIFLDTHLGYAVFALSFMLLSLLFGMSMSRLPADHRLIAHMEMRLAHTSREGQRRIFRRDIFVGLAALVSGAVLSVLVSLVVPYVAVGFVGLMAYGVLKFGVSFGVWLRHRFA
jgi:hypothetical protein